MRILSKNEECTKLVRINKKRWKIFDVNYRVTSILFFLWYNVEREKVNPFNQIICKINFLDKKSSSVCLKLYTPLTDISLLAVASPGPV